LSLIFSGFDKEKFMARIGGGVYTWGGKVEGVPAKIVGVKAQGAGSKGRPATGKGLPTSMQGAGKAGEMMAKMNDKNANK
jgi:hypothetical protein